MYPAPVPIQTIFDMILVDLYVVRSSEFFGFLPGSDLETDELDVTTILPMIEQGVADFVQE